MNNKTMSHGYKLTWPGLVQRSEPNWARTGGKETTSPASGRRPLSQLAWLVLHASANDATTWRAQFQTHQSVLYLNSRFAARAGEARASAHNSTSMAGRKEENIVAKRRAIGENRMATKQQRRWKGGGWKKNASITARPHQGSRHPPS